MNRLIIIGNGFDRAHGLPTSYPDFIDDLWGKIVENCEDYRDLVFLNNLDFNITPTKENFNFKKLVESIDTYCSHSKTNYNQLSWKKDEMIFFAVKIGAVDLEYILNPVNSFFKKITIEHADNWVDIENLYYKELKKIVKYKGNDISKSEDFWIKHRKDEVKKLNEEFDFIKRLFEKYLKEKVIDLYNLGLFPDREGKTFSFKEIVKPISIFSNESKLLDEFSKKDHMEIREQFLNEKQGVVTTKLFFLNFNYTYTIYRYLINGKYNDDIETFINFIHGEIGNTTENKINFGFGDEMDEDYKAIENINDNEYLKNFKSFQYLQNSNYKMLLDFVESEKYQVHIMGHSCGLSDRTLLNTIFENENCRSIKIFYHQKDDGSDNYTEITQNISRHFNEKKLMRSKIVNKTLCIPLPQIQLPRKGVISF